MGRSDIGFRYQFGEETRGEFRDGFRRWHRQELPSSQGKQELVAEGLSRRPELAEQQQLVAEAREIVEAHTQVEARQRQLAIAEEGISAATSSYFRNTERIRHAQGLPLEVLQSLQALAQARREYLRAVTDYNAAQFQLRRAIGQ